MPETVGHAALMDRVYRHQRHIYDATRRYYLLGRNELIETLSPPAGGTVLELGCGTGRNLVQTARYYPAASFHGIDISSEMLATAARAVARVGREQQVRLAQADATDFDSQALFGTASYDRVFISYALSMIPDWRAALHQAAANVSIGGRLHIVDFGDQARLPAAFKTMLRGWLRQFHVTPRDDLEDELRIVAARYGARLRVEPLYRGYAVLAELTF